MHSYAEVLEKEKVLASWWHQFPLMENDAQQLASCLS